MSKTLPEGGKRTPKITAKESKFLLELFSAWQGLKNLGWQEPRYFRFPENGKEFELIELGSTGIHRAVRHGGNDQTCWIDYEWPSTPFLVREVKSGRAER